MGKTEFIKKWQYLTDPIIKIGNIEECQLKYWTAFQSKVPSDGTLEIWSGANTYLPLHKLSEYDNGIQWNYNKYYNSRSIIMENKHGRRMELGNSGMCLHQQIERLLAVASSAIGLLCSCAVYACNIQSIALETHQNIFICLDGRVGRRTALHMHAKVFLSFSFPTGVIQ